MHADLEAANGSSICADYFFPRDKPGDSGITALAICDSESQFLAGHVVDAKGASAEHALGQTSPEGPAEDGPFRKPEGEHRPIIVKH